MSKLSVRVIVSILIGLAIVLGIFASVQAASPNAGTRSGSVHVTSGLMPDLSHERSAVQKLQVYMPQGQGSGHDCNDEGYNPNDD